MSSFNQTTRTMKFNHVSFPSRDVAATAAFFERYLGCTGTSFGASKILKRNDFDIVIEDAAGHAVNWPENFHIGFELDTAHEVEALYQAFEAGGAELTSGIVRHARGSRFFCAIPGGVLVEINTREDAADVFKASFARGS